MKNSIYISGVISAIVLTAGAMFKIQHWPGASILLAVSIVFFTLVFLPLALWDNYKKERKNAFLYICIFITLLICFAAALFKILHWPGAGILILIGLLAPFIIFLPAYVVYYNKGTNKDITNFIAILFLLVFVAIMDAFLAVNVSKNIIDFTVLTNQTTTQVNKVLGERNEMTYKNLSSSQSVLLDAQQSARLKSMTEELCDLIDEMKLSLVKAGHKNNKLIISDNGEFNIWKVSGKDNHSLAAELILNTGKALILKNQIKAYKEYVKSLNLKNFTFDLDEILNVDDTAYKDQSIPWENAHFGDPLMVWAIQKLDMIKLEVKMVEGEVLSNFLFNRN